jgi:hypothetical protein
MSATRPPAFDDRFTTPIEASRRGAHRARPKPVSATLPVLAGIAVILLVVGGVYIVLGGNNNAPSTNLTGAESPNPTATSAASGTGKVGTTATQAPQDSASAAPSSAAVAKVDRGVDVVVLNSVAVKGLAAKVKTKLEGVGWSISRTGNSNNKNLTTSKVYYGKASRKATAEAMVKDLGFGEVSKDAGVAKAGLVVVLGQDATR